MCIRDSSKELVRQCLEYALESRRRVKEQLKKIGGMEFYDVHFSYIDLEEGQERFISVPEQGGGSLIPDGKPNPGFLYTVCMGVNGIPGIYRFEIQNISGGGKFSVSGNGSKESAKIAFDYFKANAHRVSGSIKVTEADFHLQIVDLQNQGAPDATILSTFIALCSAALGKPLQGQMVITGDMSLGGTITQTRSLAETLQVAFDAGAKRVLIPMSSAVDIPTAVSYTHLDVYKRQDKPSLKNLMMCLLVSDMANNINQASLIPQQLTHFVLCDFATKANAKVFVSRWRSDVTLMPAYIQLSQVLAEEMQMDKLLGEMPIDDLMPIHTFGVVEQLILTALKQKILSGSTPSIDLVIQARRDGFWANQRVTKDFELTKAYAACYDAIEAAHAFFSLKEQYIAGFSFANAKEGLEVYRASIFRFDQSYRHFHYAAGLVEHLGWGLLHDLVSYVENAYSGWFIPQFSSAWDKVVDGKEGLLKQWQVDGWTLSLIHI